MTPATKQRLRGYVSYFGLQIKYVSLPEKVSGFLQEGPDPLYIFLNEKKPHSDHVFTIAHELGHYAMHLNRPFKSKMPGYLDYPWEWAIFRESTQMTKSWVQPLLDREGEADAWAFALLLRIGAVDDIFAILNLYPKKSWIFSLIFAITACKGFKSRIQNFFRELYYALAGSEER